MNAAPDLQPSYSFTYICYVIVFWHWLPTVTLILFQCEEATPRGEDRQHFPEGPADETETERVGEETGQMAILETHPAQRGRRGRGGCGPAGGLDVRPVKHWVTLNGLLFCASTWD